VFLELAARRRCNPQAGTPALRVMPDKEHLVAGLHSRGVLPHLKREGGTYFVTFRQAGTLPKEALLRFKQEREAILRQRGRVVSKTATAEPNSAIQGFYRN